MGTFAITGDTRFGGRPRGYRPEVTIAPEPTNAELLAAIKALATEVDELHATVSSNHQMLMRAEEQNEATRKAVMRLLVRSNKQQRASALLGPSDDVDDD